MLSLIGALMLAGSPAPVLVRPDEAASYAALLRTQAIDADARFSTSPCPEARTEVLPREVVRIGDRPDVAAAREKVRVIGCGRNHVENIAVARVEGGNPWKMVSGLPGESLASMPLQQTATPQVMTHVRASASPGCASVALSDIYIAARPGRVRISNLKQGAMKVVKFTVTAPEAMVAMADTFNPDAAWVEIWPLRACDADRETAIVFVPKADSSASAFFYVPIWPMKAERGAGASPAADAAITDQQQ